MAAGLLPYQFHPLSPLTPHLAAPPRRRTWPGGSWDAHGGQGSYALVGGDALSDNERDELLQLCRQRLDALHRHSPRR